MAPFLLRSLLRGGVIMLLPFVCFSCFCFLTVFLFLGVYFYFIVCFFSVSLPGDDALCWLLSCPFSSVCFPCFFFSERVPGLIWFGSIYLVTTAGFVADHLMRDKQQNNNTHEIMYRVP